MTSKTSSFKRVHVIFKGKISFNLQESGNSEWRRKFFGLVSTEVGFPVIAETNRSAFLSTQKLPGNMFDHFDLGILKARPSMSNRQREDVTTCTLQNQSAKTPASG